MVHLIQNFVKFRAKCHKLFLCGQKTYLCGTVRTNREGYPKALVQSKPQSRRKPRGNSDWLMHGPLLASFWKDNNVIYYLSTFHQPVDPTATSKRTSKDGTENHLPSTPTVIGYAKFMGGVDRLDQNSIVNKAKKSKVLEVF